MAFIERNEVIQQVAMGSCPSNAGAVVLGLLKPTAEHRDSVHCPESSVRIANLAPCPIFGGKRFSGEG